ncbi:phosphatase PAP2 family protein [Streptococcus oricebi]|uniref:Phosphatase PAP2 family protein n=1 Tax=Streptococcus oricebi TaxID=1547447 RepID=A0ABS5B3J7_9STRE|nr:phosphatase PAP2 family protein [Streptococcus oricebi]MBP2623400.1 phosphatase PAP2 family protein [Streptococcus oricebi]
MKNKEMYLTRGSFALLLFVILGYVVKFYPEQLTSLDSQIQTAIRGDLPAVLTTLMKFITSFINPQILPIWVLLLAGIFWFKKWRSESLFLLGNLALAGLLVLFIKNIYQRPRPAIIHLVVEKGYSFPSSHALAATLLIGSLIIISRQRLGKNRLSYLVQALLASFILLLLLSRVYLGVHYPTDVLAGLILGFALLNIEYPFYDRWRFQWRFKGRQK